jgi:nucleoside-diphosphate kinase
MGEQVHSRLKMPLKGRNLGLILSNMKLEKTFVLIKPDGFEKKLVGEIISRFEKKGLRICSLKLLKINNQLAKKHYHEHIGKPFYKPLISFITSGYSVAIILEGINAVNKVRQLIGPTDSTLAKPGTIRGDFGKNIRFNIVHGSSTLKSAKNEMRNFFKREEIR